MTRLALLLIASVWAVAPASAQTVYGEVVGYDGQRPVVAPDAGVCVDPGTRVEFVSAGRLIGEGRVQTVTGGRARVLVVTGRRILPGTRTRFERAGRCPAPPTPVADRAVVIASEPPGATVYSVGARLGTTPFRYVLTRPATFSIEMEGYRGTGNFELQPGESTTRRLERLPDRPPPAPPEARREATLVIAGLAADTRVTIDGAEVAVRGGRVTLPRGGTYVVAAEREGYYAAPQTVTVGDGGRRDVAFEQVETTGTLVVTSVPDGAVVTVNGSTIGTTPLQVRIARGTYDVTVAAGGYAPVTEQVRLDGADPLAPVGSHEVSVALESALSWLRVRAAPRVRVLLDGVEVGQGPTTLRLPAGRYVLAAVSAGETVSTDTVEVPARGDVTWRAAGAPDLAACERDPESDACLTSLCEGRTPHVPSCDALCLRDPARPGCQEALAPRAPGGSPTDPGAAPPSGRTDPTAAAPPAPPSGQAASAEPAGAEDPALEEVRALVRAADYPAALERLTGLLTTRAGDVDVFALWQVVGAAQQAEAALGAVEKEDLRFAREEVRRQAGLQASVPLLQAARRAVALVPQDPYTAAWLRHGHRLSIQESGMPPLAFAFVPGPEFASADATVRLTMREAPPARSFLLSTTEVSNAQFVAFLNAQPSARDYVAGSPVALRRSGGRWAATPGSDGLPVVDATWAGAAAFAVWVGGRLPSPAEWEWAFHTGRTTPSIERAVVSDNGAVGLQVVPAGPADRHGLHDLIGNAAEWLGGPASGRTRSVMGGSYRAATQTALGRLVEQAEANRPGGTIGFRVLREVEEGGARRP